MEETFHNSDSMDDRHYEFNLIGLSKAIKESVETGKNIVFNGHSISVTSNKENALSISEISAIVIKLTVHSESQQILNEFKGKQEGSLAARCNALENISEGLRAMSAKSQLAFSDRVLNFLGVQANKTERQNLAHAQQFIHDALQYMRAKVKADVDGESIYEDSKKSLPKKMDLRLNQPRLVRSLMFHRCMDHTENVEIRGNEKALEGFSSALQQAGMKEDIEGVLNDPRFTGNYSSEDREILLRVCDQLQWSAETENLLYIRQQSIPDDPDKAYQALAEATHNLTEASKRLEEAQATVGRSFDKEFANDAKNGEDHAFINSLYNSKQFGLDFKKSLLNLAVSLNQSPTAMNTFIEEAAVSPYGPFYDLSAFFSPELFNQAISNTRNAPVIIAQEVVELAKKEVQNASTVLKRFDEQKLALEGATDRVVEQIKQHADDPIGVIFSGGIPNHAMMYKVNKASDGTYTFSVLNTGLGIRFHHSQGDRFQTHLQWSGLDKQQVTDPHFIRELLRFNQRVSTDAIGKIYGRLKQEFGHPDPASTNPADYHKPQESGTCTQKVINTWLHLLPEPTYNRLKRDMTERAIEQFERYGQNTKGGLNSLEKTMLSEMKSVLDRRQKKLDQRKQAGG